LLPFLERTTGYHPKGQLARHVTFHCVTSWKINLSLNLYVQGQKENMGSVCKTTTKNERNIQSESRQMTSSESLSSRRGGGGLWSGSPYWIS